MRLLAFIFVAVASVHAGAAETLIACTAKWCGPCKQFHRDYAADPSIACGRAVRMVDVDDEKQEARRLGVRSMPTFILMDDGKEVRRTTGYEGAAGLRKWLDGR